MQARSSAWLPHTKLPSLLGPRTRVESIPVWGVSNYIGVFLNWVTKSFFTNLEGTTDIKTLELYTTAHIAKYFGVLVGILMFAIMVIALPMTRRYLARVLANSGSATPLEPTEHESQTGVQDGMVLKRY